MTAVLIGTSPECSWVVADQFASSRHCVVHRDGEGQVWVTDLGSMNGTWIRREGQQASRLYPTMGTDRVPTGGRLPIGPGDVLIVGRTEIPWSRR